MALRNFEAADKTADRVIAIAPQSLMGCELKGYVAVAWKGDLSVAEKHFDSILAEFDPHEMMTWARFWLLMQKRKFPEALAILQKFHGEMLATYTTAPSPKAFLEGMIYLYLGDKEKAQPAFEHARALAEKLLLEAPQDSARHGQLGLILAFLGRKEEAIAEGKRAVELLPESEDAFDGPQATTTLAQIYAWTGESDDAFRLLDHLLVVPKGLTVPILKLHSDWDPLRKDPRFQALIDKHAGKH